MSELMTNAKETYQDLAVAVSGPNYERDSARYLKRLLIYTSSANNRKSGLKNWKSDGTLNPTAAAHAEETIMKLTGMDEIILTSLRGTRLSAPAIGDKIYLFCRRRVGCSWLDNRLAKLIRVGLIKREGFPATGQTHTLTELGEKLLRAGEKSRQKEQKEGGRCNLS